MALIHMSSPWVVFYREVEEMFKYDKEVHVVFDEEKVELRLYVDNPAKAEALEYLLPEVTEFGNVQMYIYVYPSNSKPNKFRANTGPHDMTMLYETALEGNGVFSFCKKISGIYSNDLNYIVFANKVVQYYNDDLGDIYGQCSTLYQDIAKHIFKDFEGVYFCTDKDQCCLTINTSGLPNAYWP